MRLSKLLSSMTDFECKLTKYSEPPPRNSKPEGIALEMKTYTMSEDNQLFQPPVSYPEAPKNMYYDVPETKPKPENLTQIFPWESRIPKPTRVFVDDDQSTLSLPSQTSTKISAESSKEDSTTARSLESTFTWTYSEPPESWEEYSRSNAWDDDPEIQRYIQSIQQARKARIQVIPGASGSGYGLQGQTTPDTRLTHFPSEIERPSLPVTPAPIRRSSHIYSPEEEYATGQLPLAEGVPSQEEWVGFTVDVFLHLLRAAYLYWTLIESVDTPRRSSTASIRGFRKPRSTH